MPIEYQLRPDGLHVSQSFDPPTVYLDHWALMTFAEDAALQNRFVSALNGKRGTLVLSMISFGEFAAPDDPRHCQEAEVFIDRVIPRLFLTDLNPQEVRAQELARPDNPLRFPLSSDNRQLRLFVRRCLEEGRPLSMRGFIAYAREWRPEIAALLGHWNEQYRRRFGAARQDDEYRRKAKEAVPDAGRPRTMVIFGELMRGFALDQNAPLSDHNIIDLFHAAMPVNCCDFVLLDGAWEARVETMRQRIADIDPGMVMARCYSRRNDGLGRFLTDLESF